MQFSAPITMTGPGSPATITMNNPGDSYFVTKIDGFDDADLRLTIDNKSRADGGVVHSSYDGPLLGTFEGYIKASTSSARSVAEHNLRNYLQSIRQNDGTFTIVEVGQPSRSITIRKYQKVVFSPRAEMDAFVHIFQFMLVAPNPVWSPAW